MQALRTIKDVKLFEYLYKIEVYEDEKMIGIITKEQLEERLNKMQHPLIFDI